MTREERRALKQYMVEKAYEAFHGCLSQELVDALAHDYQTIIAFDVQEEKEEEEVLNYMERKWF